MWAQDGKKSGRKNFGKYEKDEVIARQRNRCLDCPKSFNKIKPNFHHIDFDNTNNSISNCAALCPNCHSLRHTNKPKEKTLKKPKDVLEDPLGDSFN